MHIIKSILHFSINRYAVSNKCFIFIILVLSIIAYIRNNYLLQSHKSKLDCENKRFSLFFSHPNIDTAILIQKEIPNQTIAYRV